MRRTVAVMVVAMSALALGACGDDDDGNGGGGSGDDLPADAQPYVDALVTSMQTGDDGELQLTSEQADCVAPRWVSTIGVDRMRDADVEPDDIGDDSGPDLDDLGLDEAEGNELYDAFGECDVDVQTAFIESFAADRSLGDEDRDCLAENFGDDLLRRIMVTSITQGDDALEEDEELTGELFAVLSECPGAIG